MADMPYRIPGQAPAPVQAPAEAPAEPQEELAPEPASASIGAHPLAISAEEGLPAVPQDQLLKMLGKLAALKLGAVTMYTVYADSIRAPFRDSIFEHFEEHAKEEREAAYDIHMTIVSLGGNLETKSAKVIPSNSIADILMHVLQYEKQLIKAERELIAACGEFSGLRLILEEHLINDQKHALDARRMFVTLP